MSDEFSAIEQYDRAGDLRAGGFRPVHWPDLALDAENVARLVEGLVDERLDILALAFGDEFDAEEAGDTLEIGWRTEAQQVRYAPEGVCVRAVTAVQVRWWDDLEPAAEDEDAAPALSETLKIAAEICVSFTVTHHARPFLDFMGGRVVRESDGAVTPIDPFGCPLAPTTALAWGLNGVED